MPCWDMARKGEIAALEARRFAAARLFARGAAQAVVVARFGVSRQTAHHWYQTWKQDGREGLTAAGRLGRRPRLDHQQLARVDTALRDGPRAHGFRTDLWTLPRIAELIERLTGVRYHPGHVWYLLRRLNWSLQRPARRARERNEAAIRRWVARRWPAVKKTPGASEPGSSSRTKAAFPRSPSSVARGRPAARRPS
jgi:transposase